MRGRVIGDLEGSIATTRLSSQLKDSTAGSQSVGSAEVDAHVLKNGNIITPDFDDEGVFIQALGRGRGRTTARSNSRLVNGDEIMEGVQSKATFGVVGADLNIAGQLKSVTSKSVSGGSKVNIQLKAEIVVERITRVEGRLFRGSGIGETSGVLREPTILPDGKVKVISKELTVGDFNHTEFILNKDGAAVGLSKAIVLVAKIGSAVVSMTCRSTAADEESDGVAITDSGADIIDRHVEDERFAIADLAVQDGGIVMDKVVGLNTRNFVSKTVDDGRIGRGSENTRSKVLRVNKFGEDLGRCAKALINKTNTNTEAMFTGGDQTNSDPISTFLQAAWWHNIVRSASIAASAITSPGRTTATRGGGGERAGERIDGGDDRSLALGDVSNPVGLTKAGVRRSDSNLIDLNLKLGVDRVVLGSVEDALNFV